MKRVANTAMRIAPVLSIAIALNPLFAGLVSERGDEKDYWLSHSLIYATVTAVSQSDGLYSITLRPDATLSGSFDVALEPTILVTARIYGRGTAISSPPNPNAAVVVVIQKTDGAYFIPSTRALFMPMSEPLCVVKDFSDGKVRQILCAVQRLRAKDAAGK